MTDSKLFQLLRNFSQSELNDFQKFISSPYFSKGRDLLPIFKTIKAFYPDFNDENLNVEYIFGKLFPKKKFNGKKSYNIIKTLTSQLFLLSKDFMIQLELKDDKKMKAYLLLNQLRKKKIQKEFDKVYSDAISDKENFDKGSVKDFVKDYLLDSILTEHTLDKDEFKTTLENTFTKSENIIAAALISCFKFEDEKNIAHIYNLKLRFTLMSAVLDNINPGKLIETIEINNGKFAAYFKIYFMIYTMNKNKNETSYYFETKKLLEDNFHLFGQSENHELWNTMLTYCNSKNFTDEDALFRKELFLIYDKMLYLEIHKRYPEDFFHIVLFRNIIISAAALKKYDWLENFINNYSKELHLTHREDMKNYSFGYLCFLRGEFENALEYVVKVRYELFLYKHDVKLLQIRIYYELGYIEEAFSLIDTLFHYLKNTSELPEVHKDGFRNFLSYTRELCKIRSKESIDTRDLEYLSRRIKNDKRYGLKWILEKVNELKKL